MPDMDHATTVRHMGRGTVLMLAAKNFVKTPTTLQFDIGKGAANKVTRIVITLNAHDLYNVQGYRWKTKLDLVEVDKTVDIQAENLQQALYTMVGA
jgi:hypothetical protein